MDEQGREPVDELTLEPARVVRRRRPRALWAAIAVVGIATGALVVTSSDDGGRRPGLPVALAFGGTGRGGAEAAADAMLAWVTYVAGDDLPALGGDGTAHRLSGQVDEARVRALAGALGVEGEVQRSEGGWSVTGEGGLGRLEVFTGGGAHWSWFSGHQDCVIEDGSIGGCASPGEACVRTAAATECVVEEIGVACEPGVDCAIPTTTYIDRCTEADPEGDARPCGDEPTLDSGSDCVDDDCIVSGGAPGEPAPAVEPREPAPPPDDVAEVALAVVAASGLDVGDAIVTGLSSAGEEGTGQWFVTVEPRLDGIPSGLLSYVEISADRRVLSGSGVLGTIEGLGGYPLLDTRAAIERANAHMGERAPGVAVDDLGSSEPGAAGGGESGAEGTTGGSATDVGGLEDPAEPTDTTLTDPCAVPEGASDGCGGTTGCGGDGCIDPATTIPCKVQPDGREICEVDPCPLYDPAIPPEDGDDGATTEAPPTPTCAPPIEPVPEPVPLPEPEPVEIVLVDAERSLVLLPATDSSDDAYLVPAYRFTAEDFGHVDLPAISDEALTGPSSTDTTVPDTVGTVPEPVPEPEPCELLEEGDTGGSTHTIQPCPAPNEDGTVLGDGEQPAIGVAYYVDIDLGCELLEFADALWINPDGTVHGWVKAGETHEGGTFTLASADHGTFVGDAAGTKVADFRRLQPNEDVFCTPEPRS